jgi:hypothetical protein
MRALRTIATCCLFLVATGLLTGCATDRQADTPAKIAQDKQRNDMTTAQKVEYFMSWPVQWGLFYGGSALAGR